MIPSAKFRVFMPGDVASVRKGEIPCVIGHDVQIDAEALEDFCFQLLSEREYELALLAGVVAFADRSVRRLHSEGWARHIEIGMPVRRPDDWHPCESSLQELLQFLTGDHWEIKFTKPGRLCGNTRQDVFPLGGGNFVVVPYSNGLDSYAQSQLLKLKSNRLTPIRVTTWNRALAGQREWKVDADGTKYRRVSVPIRFKTDNHPEPSYRARSFLFNVFAGLAAHLAQAECVLVPENGQGSLGPSILPFGSESPHRGSHPGFTRKLGGFLELVLGRPVRFEHPQLWRTKGEVLQVLKEANLLGDWINTTSCPRDRRDISLKGKLVHCGVCAACLLRRAAAHANGLVEPANTYLWTDLTAPALSDSIHPDADRRTSANDIDIASHGVLDMTELANLADAPDDDPSISQCAFEISGAGSMISAQANLKRLLKAHKHEWESFRAHLGPHAWINSNFTFV